MTRRNSFAFPSPSRTTQQRLPVFQADKSRKMGAFWTPFRPTLIGFGFWRRSRSDPTPPTKLKSCSKKRQSTVRHSQTNRTDLSVVTFDCNKFTPLLCACEWLFRVVVQCKQPPLQRQQNLKLCCFYRCRNAPAQRVQDVSHLEFFFSGSEEWLFDGWGMGSLVVIQMNYT